MGDAGIKSAIQGSNVPNPDEAVPSFFSGAMVFFFNDTATTEIYTLSLHDALPICWIRCWQSMTPNSSAWAWRASMRSEEHTSELQSRQYLVCRLLLEKKKEMCLLPITIL